MPKMNGTGPEGKDPGTGRGQGRCRNASEQGSIKKPGKGMGYRRGEGVEGKVRRRSSGLK